MRAAMTALGLSLSLIGTSLAQEAVTGPATVTGSDTLTVKGTKFQLSGLDAVELQQSCFVDGQAWACGAAATRALQTLVEGVTVTCTPTGKTNGDVQYAVCSSEGQDVGQGVVQAGWAVADPSSSDAYVATEKAARDGALGIWRGTFLKPSEFRAEVTAIEQSYLPQADASILADAEKIVDGATGIDFFPSAKLVTAGPQDSAATSDQQVTVTNMEPGFVVGAISTQDIFSWPAVSRVLETWRQSAVAAVITGVHRPIWDGLLAQQHKTVETNNEKEYLDAIHRYAADWTAQGRQPILLTPQSIPGWVTRWFSSGGAPDGAKVERKAGIRQAGYLGTIDGVDVYSGAPMPTDNSLLLPADLLSSVTYRKDANGTILTIDQASETTSDLKFKYSVGLEWKPDQVIWMHYPYEVHQ